MACDLRALRAHLSRSGLSRREAAVLLCLSTSALNKKLRGERRLYPEEEALLRALPRKGVPPCP